MAELNNKEKNGNKPDKETLSALKKIAEYKLNCEANVVSCLYKSSVNLFNVSLSLCDFSNNIWKVYFQIAHDIIVVEKKKTLDDMTIGFYLEKHLRLKAKYEEYGGYKTIENAKTYVNTDNLDGYVKELKKWNAVIKLCKHGFPIKNKLSEYVDLTAEDIYREFEVILNDTFININDEVKRYDICDGIDELIEELDNGVSVGLPYYNMPMINKLTAGQLIGNITLVGGLSNVGKSTFARSSTLPSIINNNEKIVIMLNEESIKKWQREMIVWIANNIFKYDLQKHTVRNGRYTSEVRNMLNKSVEWLKEKTKNHVITVIPFKRYETSQAIKVIKKYGSLGVKYFILDTFKMDAGKVTDKSWVQMQQSMVDINDTIKEESMNVHILITFQLAKSSARQRFYTQDNIGVAKNIVDPVSTCIMIRDLYEDEYTGERKEVKIYRLEGTNGKTKIPVKTEKGNRYQILFVVKNREGSSNDFQIVFEHDLSRNILKEMGITNVPLDF